MFSFLPPLLTILNFSFYSLSLLFSSLLFSALLSPLLSSFFFFFPRRKTSTTSKTFYQSRLHIQGCDLLFILHSSFLSVSSRDSRRSTRPRGVFKRLAEGIPGRSIAAVKSAVTRYARPFGCPSSLLVLFFFFFLPPLLPLSFFLSFFRSLWSWSSYRCLCSRIEAANHRGEFTPEEDESLLRSAKETKQKEEKRKGPGRKEEEGKKKKKKNFMD